MRKVGIVVLSFVLAAALTGCQGSKYSVYYGDSEDIEETSYPYSTSSKINPT